MSQSIFSAILGFILGVAATLILQGSLHYMRLHDPARQEKLDHLQVVRAWMDSYKALFDSTYPECPELILAHKMLSQKYPHYDKAAPEKLYNALIAYRALQIKHDQLSGQARDSLLALSDKNLDRLYGLNKTVSSVVNKAGLLKGRLVFPVSFPTGIDDHLKIIDQYRDKVFEEFPRKVIQSIEWEKLDQIQPEQLSTIVHPQLDYFQKDEDISRDREKESKLFDEMQNLSFYRIVAKKEIEAVIQKVHRQEERYSFGTN